MTLTWIHPAAVGWTHGGRGQESKRLWRRRLPASREVSCVRASSSSSSSDAASQSCAQDGAERSGSERSETGRRSTARGFGSNSPSPCSPPACAGWLSSHPSDAGCSAGPRRHPTRDGRAMDGAGSRCKIVVVGDTQCGKTALLHVFAKDCYPEVHVRVGGVRVLSELAAGFDHL